MKPIKILVAEDEAHMRKVVQAYLKKEGFLTRGVENGKKVLEILEKFEADLLVLDLMLPGLRGEEICRRLRQYSDLPVLMLTARGRPQDRIKGFNLGADDYLVKPFHPEELIVRIKAILRRSKDISSRSEKIFLKKGKLKIDFEAMAVKAEGKKIDLTHTEFKILKTLIEHAGQVLSREQILNKTLGWDYDGFDRTIDVHIKNIRRKLSFKKDEYIKTVYGAGYKFVGDIDE